MKAVNTRKAMNSIESVVRSLVRKLILCPYLVARTVVTTDGIECVIDE